MLDWLESIDLPSLILGAALGALMSIWLSYYIRRPKLQVTGGGRSQARSMHTIFISVTNSPGLLGIKLPETTILGIRIHPHIQTGLVVDRDSAHQCRAWLYDKATKQFIKPLWWQISDGKMTQEVTSGSGEGANLMLFARLTEDARKYFIYQLDNPEGAVPIVPDDRDKFDSTREFYIDIQHSYGMKRMRIECAMIKRLDGVLHFKHKGGTSSF